ncbi:MAG: phosphoribosyltransferase family protein, partial [Candidatus Nanopelagicales bacterium]
MFTTRHEAGRRLAEQLLPLADEHPVVLGLARGGVPVAVEVAKALGTVVDVLVVRKLGSPWNPEFGFGSVGEGDVAVIDYELAHRLGVTDAMVDRIRAAEQAEVRRRERSYRLGRTGALLRGRLVIIVDDGIATGSTVRTAVELVRQRGARRIVVAAPVASPHAVTELGQVADDVVVVTAPPGFRSVGEYYRNFSQVPDADVVAALASAPTIEQLHGVDAEVRIPIDRVELPGHLVIPVAASGVVLFAHGSGSSRFSPRNVEVAQRLHAHGIGTLLFDLLTGPEETDRHNVFDIELLAERLLAAARWVSLHDQVVREGHMQRLPLGYFGASTGGGAALLAAASDPGLAAGVVSRGGRPDLAGEALRRVRAPVLLIVGGQDDYVLAVNRRAASLMTCPVTLDVVPGATHLFAEAGAMEHVAELAAS